MARIQLTAALLLVAGMVGMSGCNDNNKVTGGVDKEVKSTYGNVTDWDENAWNKRPAPAPAPVAAKPAPAPAPAPRPAPVAGNCMYLPTGDKVTSALSICCRMPGEVTAGQNFTYDVEICNLTSNELQNVVVVYTLDGAKIVTSDPPISGTGFAVGNLAGKACRTIKVTANAAGTGMVKGCTSATWSNSLCCGTNVVSPALKIVKSVTPTDGVTKCDVITYTITVSNTGTGNATNVKVRDELPNGVKTSDGRTVVDQSIGTLAAGQSQTITFQAMLPKDGSYSNVATASADNNLSATSAPAVVVGVQPVLSITRACPKEVYMTNPATFDVTVSNTGNSAAKNVVVEDTVPAGAKFVSASDGGTLQGGKVVWSVGELAAKANKTMKISYNLTGEHNSTVTTTSSARATCADPATASCQTKIMGSADIGTMLTDNDGVVQINTNHTYSVEVKNQGQITLTNTKFTVTMPDGMTFVSSSFKNTVAGNKITFDIGSLAPGSNSVFSYIAKCSKAGEALSVGETTCTELRTPVRDDELTNFVDNR